MSALGVFLQGPLPGLSLPFPRVGDSWWLMVAMLRNTKTFASIDTALTLEVNYFGGVLLLNYNGHIQVDHPPSI